jgi:hypothetical protein
MAYRTAPRFTGFGAGGPPPPDLLAILAVVFVTFSLQFFAPTAIVVDFLRLTPLVWSRGLVWQVATYPFVGIGGPSIWILLELFVLYLFGRDVFSRLGRRRFWRLLAFACIPAAVVALLVDALVRLATSAGGVGAPSLLIMQGQLMLVAVFVAAYATLNRDATIYLFFVLPVVARWFLPLEILFAFIAFLGTKDLAGFVGLCAGVGLTWGALSGGRWRRAPRETWLRVQQLWLRQRMKRLRSQRGFTVVPDREDRWLN